MGEKDTIDLLFIDNTAYDLEIYKQNETQEDLIYAQIKLSSEDDNFQCK